jgi:hypothetical protein
LLGNAFKFDCLLACLLACHGAPVLCMHACLLACVCACLAHFTKYLLCLLWVALR